MSGFQVPFSSSPPVTPDKKSKNGNIFSFGASNPSTTPAGPPPPSSSGSFTPAGPPPSSFLGSSMMGDSNRIKPLSFSQHSDYGSRQPNFTTSTFSQSPSFMRSTADTDYQASRQGRFQTQVSYAEEDEEEAEAEEEEQEVAYHEEERGRFEDSYGYGDADAVTDEDEDMGDYHSENPGARSNGRDYERSSSDLLLTAPVALRDGRGGPPISNGSFLTKSTPSTYGKIAKSLYDRLGIPAVDESDEIILSTEASVSVLYSDGGANDSQFQHNLAVIPGEITKLWADYYRRTAPYHSEEYTATIGPGPNASNFAKANFLASLAIKIHHPHIDNPDSFEPNFKPLPRTLLEWIDEHHDPYPSQVEELQASRPSPSCHAEFWNIILNSLLRGKVVAVINILKGAGWKFARPETEGVHQSPNQVSHTGMALANIEKVMGAAIQLLSQCPAVHGDWNIRGGEWSLFRLRVSQAIEDLKTFAEGSSKDRDAFPASEAEGLSKSLVASRFGSYSRIAQRAESQVPWDVYQNLLTLYSLVAGEPNSIIENATDWCEATIGLLAWWDDGKEDRILTLGRSHGPQRNSSKETDSAIYLRKLRRSFDLATAESTDFQVNTVDEIEVSLASLLEGDNEAVVCFLRGWSGPISSTVAEVASLAGWLPQAEPQSLINMDLDQDDLDLLGINSSPSKADGVKDQALVAYARSLVNRGRLQARVGPPREGWELAIAILGRLDSPARSEEMIGDFLKNFPLESSATVDKLWRLLSDIGMTRHAESIAETYANILAEGSHRYGEALWYYSLSHKTQKVKDVLDLLVSISLIQSTAYPPEPELDEHLRRLISSPKTTLSEISKMDIDAAELLQKMLSGYATLRRFYALRDEGSLISNGRKPQLNSILRNKEAASALLAVITSSNDNIRGGLYDEGRGAVVSVDFLLALLGEAMVFVNQPKFFITASQIDVLLKAIEDLQAVGPRVYSACGEFLQTVIASGQGMKGSSPSDMLRKSTSNISGTSSFSLVGSSMLASQLKQSIGSSGVMVQADIKRGWDWRHGVSAGTTGDDVLRVLRYGLAKDLAKAWLVEADNKM